MGRGARPIIAQPSASAEVCGDDVNSEHGGGGDRDQPVAALDPRDTSVYCLQCLALS